MSEKQMKYMKMVNENKNTEEICHESNNLLVVWEWKEFQENVRQIE